MERKLRTCGQMGVTKMDGTAGWTTLPPAAMLYAVEPVGVANLFDGVGF
jgi:hypothetical protein